MKKFIQIITGSLVAMALFVTIGSTPSVMAQSAMQSGAQSARGSGQPTELFGNGGTITTITNTLLFLVGALAVIMIIFGGIRYATSAGNASSVSAAKNTILYAVVGLIVAFLAFALVNWILSTLTSGVGSGYSNF